MTDEQYKEVRREFHYVRNELNKLVGQSREHNVLLKEHERRSLALEKLLEKEKDARASLAERLDPIESHSKFITSCIKWFGAILAGLIIQAIAKTFF